MGALGATVWRDEVVRRAPVESHRTEVYFDRLLCRLVRFGDEERWLSGWWLRVDDGRRTVGRWPVEDVARVLAALP